MRDDATLRSEDLLSKLSAATEEVESLKQQLSAQAKLLDEQKVSEKKSVDLGDAEKDQDLEAGLNACARHEVTHHHRWQVHQAVQAILATDRTRILLTM